jgi:SsrA-binding protein
MHGFWAYTTMSAKGKKKDDGKQLICANRRARRDYDIGERLEAGLVLTGTEVKSCRAGKAHLNDAYVQVLRNEAYLMKAYIAEYAAGSYNNHLPQRERKLLLHRKEIDKLAVKTEERGVTAIPLSLYFKDGRVKAEIALGKGKTHEDRREQVKEREADREIQRAMRRGRR